MIGWAVVFRDCTDCPEVQAVTHYQATEPDELTLEESDVINVFRKVSDGKSHFIQRKLQKSQKSNWRGKDVVKSDRRHSCFDGHLFIYNEIRTTVHL